jgi:hypothetical protein
MGSDPRGMGQKAFWLAILFAMIVAAGLVIIYQVAVKP